MTYNEIIKLLSPEKMYDCPADIYGHSSEHLTAEETRDRLLYLRDYWKDHDQELNIEFGRETKDVPVWNKHLLLRVAKDVIRINISNQKIKTFDPES